MKFPKLFTTKAERDKTFAEAEAYARLAANTFGAEAEEAAERAIEKFGEIPDTVAGSPGHQLVLKIAAVAFVIVVLIGGVRSCSAPAEADGDVYSVLERYETLPPCAGAWQDVATGEQIGVERISARDIVTCVELG